jgi:hypothetical protein
MIWRTIPNFPRSAISQEELAIRHGSPCESKKEDDDDKRD